MSSTLSTPSTDRTSHEGNNSATTQASASARKRQSPTSAHASRRESLAGSSGGSAGVNVSLTVQIQSASSAKHRRIIGHQQAKASPTEDASAAAGGLDSHSGGRELRYLTDFYPDQGTSSESSGRITRSKSKVHTSPEQALSPTQGTSSASEALDISQQTSSRAVGKDRSSSSRGGSGRRRTAQLQAPASPSQPCGSGAGNSSSEGREAVELKDSHYNIPSKQHSSSNVANAVNTGACISHSSGATESTQSTYRPTLTATSSNAPWENVLGMLPLHIEEMVAAAHNANVSQTRAAISAAMLMPSSSSSAMMHAGVIAGGGASTSTSSSNQSGHLLHHSLVNQIPVIQAPSGHHQHGGQTIALSGMLFDPLAAAPTSASGSARNLGGRTGAAQFFRQFVPQQVQNLLAGSTPKQLIIHDTRLMAIIDGLRSSNELRQAESASELAEWLLMGNEDNLPQNLPFRDIVQALIVLLDKEQSLDLMLTAARCMTNMIEAAPRCHSFLIEAVPSLLQKLKRIEFIEVAEQALHVLEEISKRNAKCILQADGISACISHVDFFSMPSQRLAFSVASNCAMHLGSSDFSLIRSSLAELTERLVSIDDKRCLESICQLFCRITENLKNHPDKLREVAGVNQRLLAIVQQLLLSQPNQLSSNTFSGAIRMLKTIASKCADLSVSMIRMNYPSTMHMLFTGSFEAEWPISISERPLNQLQEMVHLVGELFPKLPTSGVFEIDAVYTRQSSQPDYHWYYQDDALNWQPYRTNDSRLIEAGKSTGRGVQEMIFNGQPYHIDTTSLTQKNLTTGKLRNIQRKSYSGRNSKSDEESRLEQLEAEPQLLERVITQLFPVVVGINESSSGPSLRFDCLRVMLRMVGPSSESLLREVLATLPLSGHIASALASPQPKDLPIVVAALQLVHILLEKLADVYAPLFCKEGVYHEIRKLSAINVYGDESMHATSSMSCSMTSSGSMEPEPLGSRITRSTRSRTTTAAIPTGSASTSSSASPTLSSSLDVPPPEPRTRSQKNQKECSSSLSGIASSSGLSNRHRKRTSPEGSPAKKEKEPRRKSSSSIFHNLRIPGLSKSSSGSSPTTTSASPPHPSSSHSSLPPFPVMGGMPGSSMGLFAQMASSMPSSSMSANSRLRSTTTSGAMTFSSSSANVIMSPTYSSFGSNGIPTVITAATRDQMKAWIKKEADYLLKTYLSNVNVTPVLDSLSWIAEQLVKRHEDVGTTPLTQLYDILKKDDVSAFEITHSGVVAALHAYLVCDDGSIQPARKLRLRRFAAIFMSLTPTNLRPSGVDGCFGVFEVLISKVLASVAQSEQFQVKMNDMGGIYTGTHGCLRGAQALKFLQTHHIKCSLRRHNTCQSLKEYKRNGGNTIKADAFTSISAIEHYLLTRGVAHNGDELTSANSSSDDISDDDDALNTSSMADERKVDILINDNLIPSNMCILQALRQFSPQVGDDNGSPTSSIWMSTHVLYYREAQKNPNEPTVAVGSSSIATDPQAPTSSACSANASMSLRSSILSSASKDKEKSEKKHKISDKLWQDGQIEECDSPLWSYLSDELPAPVDDPSESCLLLLRALYGLNRFWYDLFVEEEKIPKTFAPLLAPSSFHSTKLSAKLSRQLADLISVATQQFPKWTTMLPKAVPFLFPFSIRRSLLYSATLGRDRALMHLVSQTDGPQHDSNDNPTRSNSRLQRRKLVIRREDLLRTAEISLASNADSNVIIEASFENEAGSGFGPTLEFYSTVSRELQNATLKMWDGTAQKSEDENNANEYVVSGHGLYPIALPHSTRKDSAKIKKFEMVGRLMAQALVDCRMLDLPLSPVFLHWLVDAPQTLGVSHLETLDPLMFSSMRSLTETPEEDFEHLEQYFTLPGNESFELMKGGRNKPVTKENVLQFIKLVAHWRLSEGVWREMEAVRRGFTLVLNPNHLSLFMPEELDQLIGGCSDGGEKVWGEAALTAAIKPDHGYTHDSEQIRWLIRMLASFDHEHQRKFVQFVTGSPRLPVGGFRALNPPLTVVRKAAQQEELPSAMTCYNYLKVPPYVSYEVFVDRFSVALRHIYSFYLT